MAKPCFHSELAKLGEFTVVLTSDVQPSKIGKANYIPLTIGGEKSNYPMENQACEAVFRQLWQQGYRNVPVVLKAEGWKNQATITFIRADQNVTKPTNHAQPAQTIPPAQPQVQAHQQNIPPAQQAQLPAAAEAPPEQASKNWTTKAEDDAVKNAWMLQIQHCNLMILALEGTELVRNYWAEKGKNMSEAELQGMKTTLYLSMDRRGQAANMPTKLFPVKKTANGNH